MLAERAVRKRGPRKNDGGRPRTQIYEDPDRWIVAAAIWFGGSPEEQRSIELIEALDNLLTPHEGVELILETRPMNDSEHGCLGIVNVTDDRIPGTNLPDRRPRSSPGEWTGNRAFKIYKPK